MHTGTFMRMHVATIHLGLAGLAVHAALLALHSRAAVPAAGHGCIRAGQGQLMMQLGGWSQNPQRVMLQLLKDSTKPPSGLNVHVGVTPCGPGIPGHTNLSHGL